MIHEFRVTKLSHNFNMTTLYNYFRSSAAYRVRIALNLKGIAYENVFVHLTRGGGEQFSEAYRAKNPQQLVPVLIEGEETLTQSLAIMEYLDEKYPQTPLLPASNRYSERARVRALALAIACDTHPLHNLRVLKYLTKDLGLTEEQKSAWISRWMTEGFTAIEAQLAQSKLTGVFCHGDTPTLADCCLVPQVFSARRFSVDLAPFPTIVRIDAACNALNAFAAAHPKQQPDFEA
jgi:maleylpyruvate isomerase